MTQTNPCNIVVERRSLRLIKLFHSFRQPVWLRGEEEGWMENQTAELESIVAEQKWKLEQLGQELDMLVQNAQNVTQCNDVFS